MNEELLNVRLGRLPIRLVVSDCAEGTMARYEIRNGNKRKTHSAKAGDEYDRPIEFPASVISDFRTHPDSEHSVTGPAPIPGGDDPGGTPVAMRAA